MATVYPTKLAEEQQQKEALLEVNVSAVDRDASSGGDAGISWLTALGFAFLTFNSGMTIYRSNGDPSAVAFVAFSYLDLVLLFLCLRFFEKGSREACWKAKNLDLGIMATSIGSAVLLHCLTMRPSTEGADGGVRSTASLLLAFSIFLCGTALTLLNLSGNVRPDAATAVAEP